MAALFSGGFQHSSTSGKTQGTSTSSRNLTPYQTDIQAPLFNTAKSYIQDPNAALAPQRTLARNQVNQDYAGAFDRIKSSFFGGTNPGASGKSGMAATMADLARRGGLAAVDQNFAAEAPQQQFNWSQLASQLLGMNFGQTTNQSGTSSGSTNGFSLGFGVGPK